MISICKECWLEFDGVDDYAEARSTSDLNFALPIKIKFETISGQAVMFSKIAGTLSNNSWTINNDGSGNFGLLGKSNGGSVLNYRAPYSLMPGSNDFHIFIDTNGDLVQEINSVEISRDSSPNVDIRNNSLLFSLGRLTGYYYGNVKIYSFQIGTETFPMNEGSGTTITGSEGTVLDIYGATWNCSYKDIADINIGTASGLKGVSAAYIGTPTGLNKVWEKI